MKPLLQPLRDEHQHLRPHVEALRAAADAVGHTDLLDLRVLVDRSYEFLTHHLLPHAESEDAVLYPAVQQVLGSELATATMGRDHTEVGNLTAALAELRLRLATVTELDDHFLRELRRLLYGLFAVVTLHFAKEEEIYVPLLEEHLTAAKAAAMLTELAAAHA